MDSAERLVIRVGTRVSTEAMGVHRQALHRFSDELHRARLDLQRIEGASLPTLDTVRPAAAAIADARDHVWRAQRLAETAAAVLGFAEQLYSDADVASTAAARAVEGEAGWLAGAVSPLVLLLLAPALPGAAFAAMWAANTPALSRPITLMQRRFLNSRAAVEIVRSGVMAADDAVGGALRLPRAWVQILGDRGLGITGVASTTGLGIIAANRLGLLQEGPVHIRSTTTQSVTPPRGLVERLERIPRDGRHQVRVERYSTPTGGDRFEVYVGGTIDPSPVAGRQVLDMTSNAHGVAEASPASLRAVEAAMAKAGVTADAPVTIAGYSQGGLVAALVAESGRYNVETLIEVGAPSGQVEVPDTVSRLRVEHSSDVVTALGGDVVGEQTLRIQRDPMAAGVPDGGSMLPAHEFDRYLETAALADRSADERISERIRAADSPLARVRSGTATSSVAVREVSG